MKKEIRLYNVMFPVWFLLLYPLTWLAVLPVNFGVDLLVLWLCCRKWNQPVRPMWKREIWLCWIFGFLGDIAGATLLFGIHFIPTDWMETHVLEYISWNPYQSFWSVFFLLLAMLLSSAVIYALDRFVAFRRMEKSLAAKFALAFAIATAPYTFLIPNALLYSGTL